MTPYYQDDLVTLYCGDCRDVTAWLDADVLVTDPPYGRNWKQGQTRGNHDAHAGIAGDHDTSVRDAALSLWGQRPAVIFGDLLLPPPFGTRQVLVYKKPPGAGSKGTFGGFRRDVEAVYLRGPWEAGHQGRSSVLESGARSQVNPNGVPGRYGHPHAKPVDVMQLLIAATSGVVADPFAGSGSTLVAAKLSGRPAVGVELDERYCEIAASRLAQDVLDFGEAS